MDVRLDRIDIGWDDISRRMLSHLVEIEDDMRPPWPEDVIDGNACLGKRMRVPVPIVVVARVPMIEAGWLSSFGGGSQGRRVPVMDHVHAIRIEGRDDEYDGPVEDAQDTTIP